LPIGVFLPGSEVSLISQPVVVSPTLTANSEGKMPLKQAHTYCINEMNESYVPRAAGRAPLLTLYKDCMEQQGFTKTGSEEVPLEWVGNDGTRRTRDGDACRGNNTCIFFPVL
jgi:hypothetical protein